MSEFEGQKISMSHVRGQSNTDQSSREVKKTLKPKVNKISMSHVQGQKISMSHRQRSKKDR